MLASRAPIRPRRTLPIFAARSKSCFSIPVDHAERTIYIESQYLTNPRFADRLVNRMREKPELEAVIVLPKFAHSWLEQQTMQAGLLRSMHALAVAGLTKRVQLVFPQVTQGSYTIDTMVHSKVMIVDDTLIRVGSANLNNRSLVLDTECDLAFEARTEEHRAAIARLRDGLIGHHCGVAAEAVAAKFAQTGSLVETALALSEGGHAPLPLECHVEYPGVVFIRSNGWPTRSARSSYQRLCRALSASGRRLAGSVACSS